ncbi:hypothetical protein J4Q44_G00290560, partial [Coregonus suidteri]
MMPQRIRLQYEACLFNSTSLIGCQVRRDPEGSTERYTRWINNISQDQLTTQVAHTHSGCVCMGGSRARRWPGPMETGCVPGACSFHTHTRG